MHNTRDPCTMNNLFQATSSISPPCLDTQMPFSKQPISCRPWPPRSAAERGPLYERKASRPRKCSGQTPPRGSSAPQLARAESPPKKLVKTAGTTALKYRLQVAVFLGYLARPHDSRTGYKLPTAVLVIFRVTHCLLTDKGFNHADELLTGAPQGLPSCQDRLTGPLGSFKSFHLVWPRTNQGTGHSQPSAFLPTVRVRKIHFREEGNRTRFLSGISSCQRRHDPSCSSFDGVVQVHPCLT